MIILGGGISGLSIRYFLSQYQPHLDITLLEKDNHLGGLIQSNNRQNFFFESGARTFKASKSHALLRLIQELGMEKELLVSRKEASGRYLWKDEKLQPLPKHPLALFSSPLVRPLIPSLLKEWKQKSFVGDESIHSFVSRRLGAKAAKTLFDPMTLGIYAGDIEKLSVKSCFPALKKLEEEHGSITKGMLKKKKKSLLYPEGVSSSSLFTLKAGVGSLIEKLAEKGEGEIVFNALATNVHFKETQVEVEAGGKTFTADHLFCALSAKGAEGLTKSWDANVATFFQNLEHVSLSVIHLGFNQKLLKQEGFGYLIPSIEREEILGVVFDSSAFPDQNMAKLETRLTVMMGGAFHPEHHLKDKDKRLKEALKGIQTHLGIIEKPAYTHVVDYPNGIPQFTVGHQERKEAFQKIARQKYPHVTFLGNYLDGVAVSDCVANAKELALLDKLDV